MPEYDFRIRFNLPGQDHINCDFEELTVLQGSDGTILRLRSGERGRPIKDHPQAALIGGPYASATVAREAAEQTKTALLIWAVRNRVGIDFGGRLPRGVITADGRQWLEGNLGSPVRSDLHGIDIYEHIDGLVFVRLNTNASVGKSAPAFVEQIADTIEGSVTLSEKQVLAGEILSVSYFDASDRSRFVTLISAVEALLDPQPRSNAAQKVVERMRKFVEEGDLDESTREAMSGSLQWLKRESIGQAGRALAAHLLGDKMYGGQKRLLGSSVFVMTFVVRSCILGGRLWPYPISLVFVLRPRHSYATS